jgi:hypothetical protein
LSHSPTKYSPRPSRCTPSPPPPVLLYRYCCIEGGQQFLINGPVLCLYDAVCTSTSPLSYLGQVPHWGSPTRRCPKGLQWVTTQRCKSEALDPRAEAALSRHRFRALKVVQFLRTRPMKSQARPAATTGLRRPPFCATLRLTPWVGPAVLDAV